MPNASKVLTNGDGPIILVRAETAASALDLAVEEARDNDLVVTDEEADIRVGWVRATPCRQEGHETRDGFDWCDGGLRCHYAYGKPGPGAFRGAFVNVRYWAPEDDEQAPAPEPGTAVVPAAEGE